MKTKAFPVTLKVQLEAKKSTFLIRHSSLLLPMCTDRFVCNEAHASHTLMDWGLVNRDQHKELKVAGSLALTK